MRDKSISLDCIRILEMTRHFEERLRERLGIELTLEAVNMLLSQSKRIRRQQTVYKLINGEFRPRKIVAEFWNHEHGFIMLVDEWSARAITVVTPNDQLPLIAGRPRDHRMARNERPFLSKKARQTRRHEQRRGK